MFDHQSDSSGRGRVLVRASIDPAKADDLRRLGKRLNERTSDVVVGMIALTTVSGRTLDGVVEESFSKVGTVSTVAVARWMAGEGEDVAREVGQDAWKIFGQLAAQRAAPLNEVTKRCLRWRDATALVMRECAAELQLRGRGPGGCAADAPAQPRGHSGADVRVVRG